MSDTKIHIFCAAYSTLYHTKDTRYQLMSVDVECPWPHLGSEAALIIVF